MSLIPRRFRRNSLYDTDRCVPLMQMDDVSPRTIDAEVQRQGREFTTFDISDTDTVRHSHGLSISEYNYRAIIGKYLSNNKAQLGIEQIRGSASPARWRKVGAI